MVQVEELVPGQNFHYLFRDCDDLFQAARLFNDLNKTMYCSEHVCTGIVERNDL